MKHDMGVTLQGIFVGTEDFATKFAEEMSS
jgi:hypothetical protein